MPDDSKSCEMILRFNHPDELALAIAAVQPVLAGNTPEQPRPAETTAELHNSLDAYPLEDLIEHVRERLKAEGRTLRVTNKPGRKPGQADNGAGSGDTEHPQKPEPAPEPEPEPEPEPADAPDASALPDLFDEMWTRLSAALQSDDAAEKAQGRKAMRSVQMTLGVTGLAEVETDDERQTAITLIADILNETPEPPAESGGGGDFML